MVVLQVFYQLATQHLSSVSEWSEDPPIIQIGGGRFTTCSQADFLTRCVVALRITVYAYLFNWPCFWQDC